MSMDNLKEAIKRRRMSSHHMMEMSPEGHGEHEQMNEHPESVLAKSPVHMAGKSQQVENDGMSGHELSPDKKHVEMNTEHEEQEPNEMSHGDQEEDMEMMSHMMHGMSDYDKSHSMNSKPRSLGERVRQSAVMRSMKK